MDPLRHIRTVAFSRLRLLQSFTECNFTRISVHQVTHVAIYSKKSKYSSVVVKKMKYLLTSDYRRTRPPNHMCQVEFETV